MGAAHIRMSSDRFWAKVDREPGQGPNGDCWKWTGYAIKSGKHLYGRTTIGGQATVAHRLAWMFWHGAEPPRELDVCHRCDFALCQRPDHLFLGTHRDNMHDMAVKGRANPPRLRGEAHPSVRFTDEQVLEMRRRRAAGESLGSIAQAFNTRPTSVCKIAKGHIWTHLPLDPAA